MGSWAMRLQTWLAPLVPHLRRNLGILILALLALEWAVTGIRVIREDEHGVVLRWGAVDRVAPAGILFTLPWPVERTIPVKTSEVRTMPVGYKLVDSIRGIPPDANEIEWITGDTNIINLTLTLKYSVGDPVDYLFRVGPIDSDFLVRQCAEASLSALIATLPVDELLTSGKIRVQEETRKRTQGMLAELEAGIRIVSVNLGSVEPPASVIDAFNEVSTAKSERARLINQADGYRRDLIPRARAMAGRLVQRAHSYEAETVQRARGQTSQYLQLLSEARKARQITETRLYLEALERILPRARKIVVEEKPGNTIRIIE